MLNRIKNLHAKEWFIITLLMLIITDLIITLNLPLLRDIIPFLFFTIVPGFLIISILKLNKIEFLKKAVLSIGLSVSVLLGVGLLLNSFYPLLLKPLALTPVLISLNITTIILTYFAYQRNKNDFNTFQYLISTLNWVINCYHQYFFLFYSHSWQFLERT